ncbi:MAG TPA: HAD-IA family hydrolase [Candidatus Limnocylindrales bacterium]|nr:HAD-IA family hydrolase [Candidatus Limnocylindrales bacterium]
MIKAVIFDVDGVLIDSFEANLKFYQNLFMHAGHPSPTRDQILSLFHVPMYGTIKALIKSENEAERVYLIGSERKIPYPVDMVKSPENAEIIIKNISKKFKIGIVTARVKIGISEIPLLIKLKRDLNTIVTYEDTKAHKPDPEPLILAAKQLDLKPKYCVYIGDSLSDIQAAKAAGMKSIAYPHPLDGADAWVSSFDELPDAILKL